MSNLIAIANFIGLNLTGASAAGAQDIITELGLNVITEETSQNMITE